VRIRRRRNSVLPFIAQAIADGNIGTALSTILRVQAEIEVGVLNPGVAVVKENWAGSAADWPTAGLPLMSVLRQSARIWSGENPACKSCSVIDKR